MKTSTKIIFVGGIVVPLLAGIGVAVKAAPLAKAAREAIQSGKGSEGSSAPGNGDYSVVVIPERSVEIAPSSSVDFDGVWADVSFDGGLKGAAKVEVNCREAGASVETRLSSTVLSFKQKGDDDRRRCRVRLVLPATGLDVLTLDCGASRCQATSQVALRLKELHLNVGAANAEMAFADLASDKLSVQVGAGKLQLQVARLGVAQQISFKNGAGQLEVEAPQIVPPGRGSPLAISVQNAAGKSELELGGGWSYDLQTENALGKLEVTDGDRTVVEAKGTGEQKVGAASAPVALKISNAVGKVEVKLGK